jgi:hypothetical protein
MAENNDQSPKGSPAFDPAIQTENLAFAPDEMVVCDCGRKNPPNRLHCLYCGAGLAVEIDGTTLVKAHLRKLEEWERGYNLVKTGVRVDPKIPLIAGLLSLDADTVSEIINAATSLPLARVESAEQADLIRNGLENLGVETKVVNDTELDTDKPPVRLNGIEMTPSGISVRAFNTGEVTAIDIDEPVLMVTGILSVSRIDAVEKRRRSGGKATIDETATNADEMVLDLYCKNTPNGFRVNMAGFDFSCLGADKSLLAGDNMGRLVSKLKEHLHSAHIIDAYASLRQALGNVWEIESRNEAKGVQRAGFAKFGFASVSSTSNATQFTKYSRLQWHLYENKG